MTSMDELNTRVTALESEVRAVRQDAAAARVLAGGADRDVAAMEATLRDHTAKLDSHSAILDSHTAKLDSHSAILDSHSAKLDMHKVLLESLRETQVEQGHRMDSMETEMRRGFSMLAVGQAEILALLNRPDDAGSAD